MKSVGSSGGTVPREEPHNCNSTVSSRTVIVAFDPNGHQRLSLQWLSSHDSGRRQWLLVRTIPATTPLPWLLRRLMECDPVAGKCNYCSTSLGGGGSIQAVRVGYVIAEVHCISLLVKCCCSDAGVQFLRSAKSASSGLPLDVSFESVEDKARGPDGEVLQLDDWIGRFAVREDAEVCPICQVEPLVTQPLVVTLCQHSFHLRCYSQVPDNHSGCPMCRMLMYDLLNRTHCELCGTSYDLWTCLICGHVGCGQLGRGNHNAVHFQRAGHSCSVQCSSNRLWNHSTGLFIHQEVSSLLCEAQEKEEEHHHSKRGYGSSSPGAGGEVDEEESSEEEQDLLLSEMSWLAKPGDAESVPRGSVEKEKLVHDHYTSLIKVLTAEQLNWFRHNSATAEARLHNKLREQQLQVDCDCSPGECGTRTQTSLRSLKEQFLRLLHGEAEGRRQISQEAKEEVQRLRMMLWSAMKSSSKQLESLVRGDRETCLLLQHSVERWRQCRTEAEDKMNKFRSHPSPVDPRRAYLRQLEEQIIGALA